MANEPQQQSGFELYHIPQQSRRDKLRFTGTAAPICSLNSYEEPASTAVLTQISPTQNHNSLQQDAGGGCIGYLPLYDPSPFPPDPLTCASPHGFSLHHHHPHSSHLLASSSEQPSRVDPNPSSNFVKEEGTNNYIMGAFAGSATNNGSAGSISFIDPHGSLAAIPGQAQSSTSNSNNNNNNGSPFLLCPPQNRDIGHSGSGSGGELVLYKPEPLNRPQGLSLSLSSSSTSTHQTHLSFARYPGPLGPFTGYASVLTGSRYLRPAQMLLQEICDVGLGDSGFDPSAGKTGPDLSLLDPPTAENLRVFDDPVVGASDIGSSDQRDRWIKSRLISMLDEVCRCYKQYYHQLQAVVASFESVPGLSNAAPFANLAFKAMSRQFRSLISTITDQLQYSTKSTTDNLGNMRIEGNPKSNCNDKITLYNGRLLPTSRTMDNHQPIWRPQRGLPERAVSVLRAWLFEHFLHPYPTDTDKMMLAKQTGLSRSQVSNWFINARVRLWKPMVEEIHALETRQQAAHHQRASSSQPDNDHHVTSASSPTSHHNHPSTSGLLKPTQDNDPPPIKRVRNEILDFPLVGADQQMSLQYGRHLPGHVGCNIGSSNSMVGSNNVSLTLALHNQNNNGVGLSSDPFPPIGLAHRFGLNGSNEGCVIGPGFEGPNCHLTRDVIGAGHLLHDFVG